jgi:hypothetical protein
MMLMELGICVLAPRLFYTDYDHHGSASMDGDTRRPASGGFLQQPGSVLNEWSYILNAFKES